MGDPRNHHFIPRFFLERWTGSKGKLIEYTKKRGKLISKPVGPKGTGFQRDLYAFPELPVESQQFIEKVFWDYADRVADKAFNLHHGSNSLQWDTELTSAWSRFILGIHLRHPDAMPELRAFAKAAWDRNGPAAQIEYQKIKTPTDPDTFAEYLTKFDPLAEVKIRVNQIIKAFDNEQVCSVINCMKWATVDVSQGQLPLLLSDRPLEFFKLKDQSGIVSIPISPDKIFVAVNDVAVLDSLKRAKPRDLAERMNRYVVGRARMFVWSHDASQSTFIAKHMSDSIESTPLFPDLNRVIETPAVCAR